jgi:hypothetical protein
MGDEDWTELGVRQETVSGWQSLGVDAFTAALAQGDGYGPSSGSHHLAGLRSVAASWRAIGSGGVDALRWHRAGFAAREASRWWGEGVPLEEAALRAGHRMVG